MSGTDRGVLQTWDIRTGDPLKNVKVSGGIEQLFVAPGGAEIWCDTQVEGVLVLDSRSLQIIATDETASGVAVARSTRSDGAYGVVLWNNKLGYTPRSHVTIRWWKGQAPLEGKTSREVDREISTAALAPDGGNLLVGTQDGVVLRLHGQGLTTREDYPGHSFFVKSLDISPDGTRFASAGKGGKEDSVVFVRAMETGYKLRTLDAWGGLLQKTLFTPDGERLVAATDLNDAVHWVNLSSGRELAFGGSDVLPVFNLKLTADGSHLLIGARSDADLWDLTTGERQERFESSGGVAISRDGSRVFTSKNLPHDRKEYLVSKDLTSGRESGRFLHEAGVTAAVYSEDRKLLATGDRTGEIHLWDTEKSREIRTFFGHSSAVRSLAFGPGGTLLSSARDDTARVWDLATGEERWREQTLGTQFSSEPFSPDGRRLATWMGKLLVFDVASHEKLAEIQGAWHTFAFTQDGKALLFVNQEKEILEVWDFDQRERRPLEGRYNPFTAKIIPLAGTLALVCEEPVATVVDGSDGKTRDPLRDVTCSQTGGPFVILNKNGHSEVWNVLTRSRRSRLADGSDFVADSFSVSADGRFMVAVNRDFRVEVWDLDRGRRLRNDGDDYRRDLSFRSALPALSANRDRYFFSSSSEAPLATSVHEWKAGGGHRSRHIFSQTYATKSLDLSPDGRRIVTCSASGSLRLVSRRTGKLLGEQENASCQPAEFSGDGRFIVATGFDDEATPQIWSSDLRRRIPGMDYRPANVAQLAVSEDGGTIVTVSRDGRLRLWDTDKGEETLVIEPAGSPAIHSVEIVESGAEVIAALEDGRIQGWSPSGGAALFTYVGHEGPVRLVRRSPSDSEVFLSVGDDRTVRVWNALSTQPARVFRWPEAGISTAAFSEDGTLVLAGGSDKTLRVWDVASGRLLPALNLPSVALSLSPGPRHDSVVVGGEDGVVRVMDLTTGKSLLEIHPPGSLPVLAVELRSRFFFVSTRAGTSAWTRDGERVASFAAGSPLAASRVFVGSSEKVAVLHAGREARMAYFGPGGFLQPTKLFREDVSSAAASPDGLQLAVGYSSGWVRLWNLITGSRTAAFRAGESRVDRLRYSRDGRILLVIANEKAPAAWNVSAARLLRAYGESYGGVRDVAFAGANDRFVLVAADDRYVHVFSRETGEPLCSLLLRGSDGWMVVSPDGQFDGSAAETRSFQESAKEFFHPGLLGQILQGKIAIPQPAVAAAAPNPEPARRAAHVLSLQKDPPEPADRNSEEPGLRGEDLRELASRLGGLLGVTDRLDLDEGGLRLETLPNGRIELGLGALQKIFAGRSPASSMGLLLFIMAHEAWHSRQADDYRFGELSLEDKRLLECQADVLGTIDAMKLLVLLSDAARAEPYAAIRLSQKRISTLREFEGSDASHPTASQRQWAVEFGNARQVARVVKDDSSLLILDRRFDARNGEDDLSWARSTCKRLLDYRQEYQGQVHVTLREESEIGVRREGKIAYVNLSGRPLKISAQARFVGSSMSPLTGTFSESLITIDSQVASFTLAPGAEHVETFSFAAIQLPGEEILPSGVVYAGFQTDNWMSVEPAEGADGQAGSRSVEASATPGTVSPARPVTCVESVELAGLDASQRALAEFLFKAAVHAPEHFAGLKRGNPIILGGVLDAGVQSYHTDLQAPGDRDPATVNTDASGSTLRVDLGSSLPPGEAEALFGSIKKQLLAICPKSAVTERSYPAPKSNLGTRVFKIPDFAKNADVELALMERRSERRSEVTLTMKARKEQ
ncbi:MAG TPA: WD40 repeat domain-containing protein [Thermoanaerobaculia bacterium]|nr:WD40 repeat domain-containing protein [Thermoanaerobaculia bacterium]